MEKSSGLRVGLIGTGRLGHLYAQYLATRIPQANLVAVAGHSAEEIANRYQVPHYWLDRTRLIECDDVDAVVICSSTDTHVQFIRECFAAKKPVFCEKPLCLDLAELDGLVDAQGNTYFQAGFMRRFDPAYVRAKEQVERGIIGEPMLFRATSRDQSRTSLEYAATSGGLIMDMGIHDLDLARWFLGEVTSVRATGKRLFYPELEQVDDVDTAILTLGFENGGMGVIDISRRGAYGYDIFTEIVGSEGAVRVGTLQRTAVTTMTKNHVFHDTYPSFMERFEESFIIQLANFVDNVIWGRPSPVTLQDAIRAVELAVKAKTDKLHVTMVVDGKKIAAQVLESLTRRGDQ